MSEGTDFPALVATFLAVCREGPIDFGLSRQVAQERAELSLANLLKGNAADAWGDLSSEDIKDVLYALVERLREDQDLSVSERVRAADGLYRYLVNSRWETDDFGERAQLLRSCAEIGWAASGTNLAEVERMRRSPGPGRPIGFDLAVPDTPIRATSVQSASETRTTDDREDEETLASYTRSCDSLAARLNCDPFEVANEATKRYHALLKRPRSIELFDEREYLLGATAELAAGAIRHLGRPDTAMQWLRVASGYFSRTTDPVPLLVRLRCGELTILYDTRKFHEVLDKAPVLIEATKLLQMNRDWLKCLLCEALSLKCLGVFDLALAKLTALRSEPLLDSEPAFKVTLLLNSADILECQDRPEEAMRHYEEALTTLKGIPKLLSRQDLIVNMGQAARLRGDSDVASTWYRSAVGEYERLGMETRVAYCRVLLVECLITGNRIREAEAELELVVPIIEREHLVLEGIALAALLRQAEARALDPEVVSKLRRRLERAVH